jgi:hypothetical protein
MNDKGAPRGLRSTLKDQVNADLLALLKSSAVVADGFNGA